MSETTKKNKYIFTKSYKKEKNIFPITNYLNYYPLVVQDYLLFDPYKRDPMLYIMCNNDTWLYETKDHQLIFQKLYLNYNNVIQHPLVLFTKYQTNDSFILYINIKFGDPTVKYLHYDNISDKFSWTDKISSATVYLFKEVSNNTPC
jgi:hypothetical protein